MEGNDVPQQPNEIDMLFVPILQVEKLRHGEVKSLCAQRPTVAGEWQN